MDQKIFIKTFGCQMNEYDSNRIFDTVKKIGYSKTNIYEEANCYVLNTCHIREKATEKVYHDIGRVKKEFRGKKKPIVIIAGCVAQAEGDVLLKKDNYIDWYPDGKINIFDNCISENIKLGFGKKVAIHCVNKEKQTKVIHMMQ